MIKFETILNSLFLFLSHTKNVFQPLIFALKPPNFLCCSWCAFNLILVIETIEHLFTHSFLFLFGCFFFLYQLIPCLFGILIIGIEVKNFLKIFSSSFKLNMFDLTSYKFRRQIPLL